MSGGRFAGHLAAAIVGAIVGALVVLGADSLTRPRPTGAALGPRPAEIEVLQRRARATPVNDVLLVWSARDGLPSDARTRFRETRGVTTVTEVHAGLDWLQLPGRRGDAVPFELANVSPGGFKGFAPPSDRAAIAGLGPGRIVLSRTSARLTGAAVGTTLRLRSGTREVVAVVDDETAMGYEGVIAGRDPRSWQRIDRYFLLDLKKPSARARVERRAQAMLSPGTRVRVRAYGETPFLRYGDAVVPQMFLKENFGVFAARPAPDGSLDIDPAWRSRAITSKRVPILGTVTCHRALFPQLRGALSELAERGLAYLIDPRGYAGCYSPRFIDGDPRGRVSHHSWGIAFDINAPGNAYGAEPTLDERVVEVFERWGFTWGGRWLVPDGMHFEWVRFP